MRRVGACSVSTRTRFHSFVSSTHTHFGIPSVYLVCEKYGTPGTSESNRAVRYFKFSDTCLSRAPTADKLLMSRSCLSGRRVRWSIAYTRTCKTSVRSDAMSTADRYCCTYAAHLCSTLLLMAGASVHCCYMYTLCTRYLVPRAHDAEGKHFNARS